MEMEYVTNDIQTNKPTNNNEPNERFAPIFKNPTNTVPFSECVMFCMLSGSVLDEKICIQRIGDALDESRFLLSTQFGTIFYREQFFDDFL